MGHATKLVVQIDTDNRTNNELSITREKDIHYVPYGQTLYCMLTSLKYSTWLRYASFIISCCCRDSPQYQRHDRNRRIPSPRNRRRSRSPRVRSPPRRSSPTRARQSPVRGRKSPVRARRSPERRRSISAKRYAAIEVEKKIEFTKKRISVASTASVKLLACFIATLEVFGSHEYLVQGQLH